MEEDRCGEADGVDAVEDAAVTGNDGTEVLYSSIALDGGHRQAARESHQGDDERHRGRLPRVKRRHRPQRRAEEGRAHNASDESFHGLVGADGWRDSAMA